MGAMIAAQMSASSIVDLIGPVMLPEILFATLVVIHLLDIVAGAALPKVHTHCRLMFEIVGTLDMDLHETPGMFATRHTLETRENIDLPPEI